jgi:hypothetical protein
MLYRNYAGVPTRLRRYPLNLIWVMPAEETESVTNFFWGISLEAKGYAPYFIHNSTFAGAFLQ